MSKTVDEEFQSAVLRTWAELLAQSPTLKDIAAIAVDCRLSLSAPEYKKSKYEMHADIEVPTTSFGFVSQSDEVRQIMAMTLEQVLWGREIPVISVDDINNDYHDYVCRLDGGLTISFLPRLIPVEDGWQTMVRALIASSKGTNNQGRITSLAYERNGKDALLYNEMKFASHIEIRIAQELEKAKVLFFPLPMAVRVETGKLWQDHREPDFLVCLDGVWGVLEISGPSHEGRYDKDAEKGTWFKHAGILCVEYYSAERCYTDSASVVADFIAILRKHRRS